METIQNKQRDVIITELEKKRKRFTLILLGVIVPAVMLAGGYGFYRIANIPGPSRKAEVKESDWNIRELSNSGGLSVESPFPLAKQTDANYEQYGGHTELYSYSYYSSFQFNIAISYYQESGSLPVLDEEVERIIDQVSSTEGLKYYSNKIDTVCYKDIHGRKLSGVFVSEHTGNKYITSVYVKDKNLWVVQCFLSGKR